MRARDCPIAPLAGDSRSALPASRKKAPGAGGTLLKKSSKVGTPWRSVRHLQEDRHRVPVYS